MSDKKNISANVKTGFVHNISRPQIDVTAFIHPNAVVIGEVTIGRWVFVGPMASIRGDEGVPFFIGDESNVQDGVVLHGLETFEGDCELAANLRVSQGQKYSIYIGQRISLAHQSQVHGPAVIMNDTFIGMQSLVFKSVVQSNCVVEPAAKIIGVKIPSGRYVSAAAVINSQKQADSLPEITSQYEYHSLNQTVVKVNVQLAKGYLED